MDPCPAVRVVAVQGVCRICNVFWEMIPPATTKAFIIKLVQELANDSGSSDVRVAVFMVSDSIFVFIGSTFIDTLILAEHPKDYMF